MAAISIKEKPPTFRSVHKPIRWGFESMRSPVNTMLVESGVPITTIGVATAADVALYPSMVVGEVYIDHALVSLATWGVGQAVLVENTNNDLYEGIWHVTKRPALNITVIDAEAQGNDTGGTVTKHYENYRLIAEVDMQNLDEVVKRRLQPDKAGRFNLDVRNIAARCFKDIFEKAVPGTATTILDASGYITQAYKITVYEAFMVPDSNGVNVYTEFHKGDTLSGSGNAVNSVQPYVHVGGLSNTDLAWEDDLAEYICTLSTTQSDVKRFLTYSPRGVVQSTLNPDPDQVQLIGEDDDGFLAFLWNDLEGQPLSVVVGSYDANDNLLGSNVVIASVSPDHSAVVPVGTRNLGGNINAAAHHYKVGIINASGFLVTETFSFQIDRTCHPSSRRFYFLNHFGGIDQYTSVGRETVEDAVARDVLTKPHMDVTISDTAGDWQRRVWRTDPRRSYTIGSASMRRDVLRWLAWDMLSSPDVRLVTDPEEILDSTDGLWTRIILEGDAYPLGSRHGRLVVRYHHGTDNVRQIT